MYHLGSVSTILPGLAVVLVGLAALAGYRLRIGRRARGVDAVPRLSREHEWELVVRRARSVLSHAPKVAELQAKATVKIESAEHAYNRLVLECAQIFPVPVEPTLEPKRTLPRKTEAVAEKPLPDKTPGKAPAGRRQPLAA